MRVLFLSKRQPQQRDLIERPYGRFHHLPVVMAALGHDIRVALCSHRRQAHVDVERDGIHWSSHDLLTLGPRRLLSALEAEADSFRPDWVVGCSDAWFGWLAQLLARHSGARLAIDAYDNYEAYMPWNLPLHWKWRSAIRSADVVTAAGPQLAALMQKSRQTGQRAVDIVPMAADPMFVPHDRFASRQSLGLPAEAPLVGYCGSWGGNRGTDILLQAFRHVREQRPDARLVLTGRPPDHALAEPGVLELGYVDDSQLPTVLSALDTACVITAETAFGRYSYPAKLYEAMACEVPVVATATEPVRWILHEDTQFLAPVGDGETIAKRIIGCLDGPSRVEYSELPTWQSSAQQLEAALSTVHG